MMFEKLRATYFVPFFRSFLQQSHGHRTLLLYRSCVVATVILCTKLSLNGGSQLRLKMQIHSFEIANKQFSLLPIESSISWLFLKAEQLAPKNSQFTKLSGPEDSERTFQDPSQDATYQPVYHKR